MSLSIRRQPLRSDRLLPWIYVAAMGVVVAVNAGLIYFAFSTWSGVSQAGAYQRGLSYNKLIAAATYQSELGWTSALAVGADRREILVAPRDRAGKPIPGLSVRLELARPLEPGPVLEISATPAGAGTYVATLTEPLRAGQWNVRVSLDGGGETAVLANRVVVQ